MNWRQRIEYVGWRYAIDTAIFDGLVMANRFLIKVANRLLVLQERQLNKLQGYKVK